MKFPELTYASEEHPRLKRWIIRSIEDLSGRARFLPLYNIWRHEIVGRSETIMGDMLNLLNVRLDVTAGQWPPKKVPDAPLVMIANHPFGIGDGIAILALAEELGRPFKVLINKELLRVPEIRPYSLSIDFSETKEALRNNMETRLEALRFLKDGGTIVVFPAGGVATASSPFGKAVELPWKTFTARLVQSANASVLPVYFEGQNGPLFHFVSRFSMTLRLSLLVREFRKFTNSTVPVRIGDIIPYEALSQLTDRKALMDYLYHQVHALASWDRRPAAPA